MVNMLVRERNTINGIFNSIPSGCIETKVVNCAKMIDIKERIVVVFFAAKVDSSTRICLRFLIKAFLITREDCLYKIRY